MKNDTNRHWGFFSQEASSRCGTEVYRTLDGREVEVTAACNDPEGSNYHWDDKVMVGEVTEWVRPGKPRKSYMEEFDNHLDAAGQYPCGAVDKMAIEKYFPPKD